MVLSGNERVLKAFRDLTGEEAALLFIKDKVYRRDPAQDLTYRARNYDCRRRSSGKGAVGQRDYQGLAIRGGKLQLQHRQAAACRWQTWGRIRSRIALDGELKRIRGGFGSLVAGKTGYVIVRPTDERPSANLSSEIHEERRWWKPDLPGQRADK